MSLTLERGKRYAVIGDSGSGKSTLLRALAGLYSGERGIVRTDSGTLLTCPIQAGTHLRSCSTLIPQDAEVFTGSIAQNLALCESLEGASRPEHFSHALQVARADFVDISNAGLDAEVAERAANWSGGLLAYDAAVAQRYAELTLYIRQCHAERDLQALSE